MVSAGENVGATAQVIEMVNDAILNSEVHSSSSREVVTTS